MKGQLKPFFIDVNSPQLRELAGELLSLYAPDSRPTRGEIAEMTAPLVGASRDSRLAKGLDKLIQDHCTFEHLSADDLPERRHRAFLASAAHLRQGPPAELETFRAEVAAEAPIEGLYADLPENEQLTEAPGWDAAELLQRYNVALVQSLLLYADRLTLRLTDAEPAKLRRLLKYLRFFRLLARVFRDEPPAGARSRCLRVEVDGPASVLDHRTSYGLQLASFFPAVLTMPQWQLRAPVQWKQSTGTLQLDQGSGLVGHYRRLGAYVPDEISAFEKQCRAAAGTWQLLDDTAHLDAGDQELLFPDFTFRGPNDRVIHLELFHRWHAGPLLPRLELLAARPELPLVIGIDRALARRKDVAAALENWAEFDKRGFLFRDFPSVKVVIDTLNAQTGRTPSLFGDEA